MKCPKCTQTFSVKGVRYANDAQKLQIGPRTPLLLKCGHVFCSDCLHKLSNGKKTTVVCPYVACQTVTNIPNGSKQLQPDYYTIGLLSLNFKSLSLIDNLKFVPNVSKQYDNSKSIEMCAECGTKPATCMCVKCDASMCRPCFEKIHNSSKALRKHEAEAIQSAVEAEPIAPAICETHGGRPIEYFCEDDQTPICSHCVIVGEHKDHAISAMEEKNKKAAERIEPIMGKVSKVYQHLKVAERIVSKSFPEVNSKLKLITDSIQEHFQDLHRRLQLREQSLIEEAKTVCVNEITPLEEILQNLQGKRKTLNVLLTEAQHLVSNVTGTVTIDAQSLLQKLEAAEEMPCFAYKSSTSKNNIKCVFEPDLDLNNFGYIHRDKDILVQILPLDQVPEEMLEAASAESQIPTPPPSPVSVASSVTDNGYSWGGSEADSESGSVNEQIQQANKSQTTESKGVSDSKSIPIGQPESVKVIHIKNPWHFMVHRYSELAKLMILTKQLTKYVNSPEGRKAVPKELSIGDIVLSQYTGDNTWYRGKVINLITNKGAFSAEVYYIDYGNTEVVPFSKIRTTRKAFKKSSGFAVLCTLIDILPSEEKAEWGPEAIRAFAKMTNGAALIMVAEKTENGKVYVDLSRPPVDDIDSDTPVSIRDALIFTELAKFTSAYSIPNSTVSGRSKRKFIPADRPVPGALSEVMISYTNNVDDFYVHIIGENTQYLHEMMAGLQSVYNSDKNDVYTIYCPKKGMVCAAKYEDGCWYRAEILSLPGRSMVQVHYVDFGNTHFVSHWLVKKLFDKYLVLPKQGVACALADVRPMNEGCYGPESLAVIERFKPKKLVMQTREIEESGRIGVSLYDTSTEEDICLNSILVQAGLAISTGPGSEVITTPEMPALTPSSQPLPNEVTVDERGESVKDFPASPQQTKERPTIQRLDSGVECPKYPEVVVSHVTSPYAFYVQLSTAGDDGLDKLMDGLVKTYDESSQEKIDLIEGESYAAKYPDDKKWYRVRLDEIQNDMAEVTMVDFGFKSKVTLDSMRTLAEPFSAENCYSMCCHLVGIQPAGDITRWSSTACEYLREIVADDTVFLVTKGSPDENDSMPCDILLADVQKGSALSADKITFTELTMMLRNKGLALPTRRAKTENKDNTSDLTTTSPKQANISLPPAPPLPLPPDLDNDETDTDDTPVDFPPADIPMGREVIFVPTYVDYYGTIFAQQVKEEDSAEGKFGFILKEHTLEIVMQDAFFAMQGLLRAKIPRDGNCLFRAFAQGLLGDQDHHMEVRRSVVEQMRENWPAYEQVLADKKEGEYLDQMGQEGCYGGEPEMQALCAAYSVHIEIFHGGLKYPIQPRVYGNTQLPGLSFSFVCDGSYDCGHYDLLVVDKTSQGKIEEHYAEWRKGRIRQMREVESTTDNSIYDESLLHQLMEHLKVTYTDSVPEPKDTEWTVDQIVIAKYHQDEEYYRGKITKIDEKGIQVLYVDFGNTDVTAPERLRKEVILTEIPLQCYSCEIAGVIPATDDGLWSVKQLEYLHNMVVGQTCHASVIEPPTPGSKLRVNLTLPTGQDVTDLLCNMGITYRGAVQVAPPAIPADLPPADQVPGRSVASPYAPLPIPPTGCYMLVTVTHVERPDSVYVQNIKQENTRDMSLVTINAALDHLLVISQEMIANAASYPPLANPQPGMACCGRYTVDDCWYRAEVIALSDQYIAVVYVDYGTSEFITPDRLCVLPSHLMTLPAQSASCTIAGFSEPSDKAWDSDTTGLVTEHLVNRALIAYICHTPKHNPRSADGDMPHVQLYEHRSFLGRGTEASLVLQPLIDEGIIMYDRPARSVSSSPDRTLRPPPGIDVSALSSSNDDLCLQSEEDVIIEDTSNDIVSWADQIDSPDDSDA